MSHLQPQSKFVDVDSVRVHYLTAGGGSKIVTLHGLAGPAALRARAREQSVSMLAGYGFEVLSLDLPGFGLSVMSNRIRNVRDYSAWLTEFLRAVRLTSPVDLVGTSMGGGIVLLFTCQFPNLARRVVVVGSTGLELNQSRPSSEIKHRAEDAIRAMFYDQEAADAYLAQGILDNSPDELNEFMRALGRLGALTVNLRSELPGIRVPTLILWGERDEISPVANAYELARLIPNSTLHIIPNCGHIPQIEKPEESHSVIANFLKG